MGHVFFVGMKSKMNVRSITISNEARNRVLFEGDLGSPRRWPFIGGGMLEVRGSNGVLMVELGQGETEKLMSQMSEERA